ncbi:MAG TPA: rhamnulokinase [Candidatus Scybalocola faecigallinarum]|uniref:Rhamnulokinase n=1 Tax=Candidatus Scybalocola faecigallinarum TaxID=2840941 RepID=A0A9D1F7W7_9FIRM|nr:rhamnulokinase [Candidatus Scybalocola faecigallinarum]
MGKYYLAVDIGASSGRHILAHLENGKIRLEEIWRFDNGMKLKNGHLCWDLDHLKKNLILGMQKCVQLGKIPESIGIDTWAVDFVLLDENGGLLTDAVGYRDSRTEGMDEEVYKIIPQDELYGRTGIQKQIFNTIYQLMAVKKESPETMDKADAMLMIPEYLNYILTGNKAAEYTNATTTQLVSPTTNDWDHELIRMLGYRDSMFQPIHMPGYVVGHLLPQIREQVGFDCEVVLVATHDTGSAVLSVPSNGDDGIYISSGTWSLMGVERKDADCSADSMKANFTNEGGYDHRFRYLKNIMGLWMIQSVRHELNDAYSFAQLCQMAEECSDFPSRVDVNDSRFLAPESMTGAIQDYCRQSGQPVPETPGELATVIYQSLASCYGEVAGEIEAITGKKYTKIHIVGGGSNADYLNALTAKASGRTVYAGPTEATAIGNIVAQMLKSREFSSLEEARSCIFDSFGVKTFLP